MLADFIKSGLFRGRKGIAEVQGAFCVFAFSRQLEKVYIPEPWELAWVLSGGQVLCLAPEDKQQLEVALSGYLKRQREEKRLRLKEIAAATSDQIASCVYGEGSGRAVSKQEANKWRLAQSRLVEQAYPELGITLADVIAGKGGILNDFLRKKWAEAQGYDLANMEREQVVFEQWLASRIVNRRIDIVNKGRTEDALVLTPAEWMECKAAVVCAMECEGGRLVYLAGVEIRRHLRPSEIREFEALTGHTESSFSIPTPSPGKSEWAGHETGIKLDQCLDGIRELADRKKRLDAETQKKGGANTFKLRDHPEVFHYLRKELKRRARLYGARGKARAIREVQKAYREKYPVVAGEVSLSDGTLRNILDGKTASVMGRNFKR